MEQTGISWSAEMGFVGRSGVKHPIGGKPLNKSDDWRIKAVQQVGALSGGFEWECDYRLSEGIEKLTGSETQRSSSVFSFLKANESRHSIRRFGLRQGRVCSR
jgi:hypothetical protein